MKHVFGRRFRNIFLYVGLISSVQMLTTIKYAWGIVPITEIISGFTNRASLLCYDSSGSKGSRCEFYVTSRNQTSAYCGRASTGTSAQAINLFRSLSVGVCYYKTEVLPPVPLKNLPLSSQGILPNEFFNCLDGLLNRNATPNDLINCWNKAAGPTITISSSGGGRMILRASEEPPVSYGCKFDRPDFWSSSNNYANLTCDVYMPVLTEPSGTVMYGCTLNDNASLSLATAMPGTVMQSGPNGAGPLSSATSGEIVYNGNKYAHVVVTGALTNFDPTGCIDQYNLSMQCTRTTTNTTTGGEQTITINPLGYNIKNSLSGPQGLFCGDF